MAAAQAATERDEALADRIGERVAFNVAKWWATGQVSSPEAYAG